MDGFASYNYNFLLFLWEKYPILDPGTIFPAPGQPPVGGSSHKVQVRSKSGFLIQEPMSWCEGPRNYSNNN
jgi:hypothetical protein